MFVTGKGGVGKTTVAMALGRVAARRGLRTIVAEVAPGDRHGPRRRSGGRHAVSDEHEVVEGLSTISIDPELALEEYLHNQLPVPGLADVLTGSRTFSYFAAATPGMKELLTIGKIWELAQFERRTRGGSRYDLVVVDAPATGHGVAILRTPVTFAEVARVGRVARQGRIIHDTLVDETFTGFVAVTQAAEMPVSETLHLRDTLARQLGVGFDQVVVNALLPARFGPRDRAKLDRALAETNGTPARRLALRAAIAEASRCHAQAEQRDRLERELGMETVPLPFVFRPRLQDEDVDRLSHDLEKRL